MVSFFYNAANDIICSDAVEAVALPCRPVCATHLSKTVLERAPRFVSSSSFSKVQGLASNVLQPGDYSVVDAMSRRLESNYLVEYALISHLQHGQYYQGLEVSPSGNMTRCYHVVDIALALLCLRWCFNHQRTRYSSSPALAYRFLRHMLVL